MTILEIKRLDKSYGSVHAVKDLSIKVNRGQVYGILGPNGSGKTTTLAMILGVVRKDSGNYFWFGQDSQPEVHRRIGALIETPNFYPYLNLEHNLQIICEIKKIPQSDIPRVLKLLGLYERSRSRFQTLSYGMKQRLALASVMLGDPDVLVLDEPANGLDPEGIAEVRQIIRQEVKRGKTIIMASHILDEVEKVCTHVAVLRKGELLMSGDVGQLLKSETELVIATNEMNKLRDFLQDCHGVEKITTEAGEIHVKLIDGYSSGDLNKALMEEGIILNKMEIHKQSLEEQFLELVKQSGN